MQRDSERMTCVSAFSRPVRRAWALCACLAVLCACQSEKAYWWEEGYPFAQNDIDVGTIRPRVRPVLPGGSDVGAPALASVVGGRGSTLPAGARAAWRAAAGVSGENIAAGPTVLAMHDVRALTMPITDFAGPRLGLGNVEDPNDEGGAFGGPLESRSRLEGDQIVELVRSNVAPGTWEEEGVSIDMHEGLLIVRHTPAVQRHVRRLLADLATF